MTALASLYVAAGSALGSILRYGLMRWIGRSVRSPFPWATWVVNVAGTLLLAVFFRLFATMLHNADWWLFAGTGFSGAFTTFATMSVETIRLLRTSPWLGVAYVLSSCGAGLVFVWALARV